MIKYILKRVLYMVPVLWVVVTATFFLMRIAPGGPFDQDVQIPEEILQNIRAKYHLDEPLYQQYFRYLGDLVQGDLGPSFRYSNKTVNEILAETLPVSAILGFGGLIFAILIGVGSGLLASSKPNSLRDYLPMGLSMLGICLPSFVIGPLFVLIFAIEFGWFNVSGLNEAKDLVLPSMTLGTMYAAYFSRLTRAGVLDIVRQDFVRTAHAKGLKGSMIMFKHCLKGGMIPSVSFISVAITSLMTGSLVVETIFDIPGAGRFFVQSALNRDYTLVMGTVLLIAFLIQISNLLVDLVYGILDPRVTYEK